MLAFAILLQAVTVPIPPVQRAVRGRTIVSNESPAATLHFSAPFRYVGSQVVRLYGNADAEQHMFVVAGPDGTVRKFYWVQFEHFLPTNQLTYGYAPTRTAEIGDFRFIYDVKSFSDYAAMQTSEPASDGAAMSRLPAAHKLKFPTKTARVRMFYLPSADRRTELMIIYGESLADGGNVPASDGGVQLDDVATAAAKILLEHARAGVQIRKH